MVYSKQHPPAIFMLILIAAQGVWATEIDQKHSIQSLILGEVREVWVSLPVGYDESDKSYPVLYVLDAQSHFTITAQLASHLARSERIPKLIVVGIPLIESDGLVRDRLRDYSPTHVALEAEEARGKPWQLSGQAHVFRKFLADEVLYWIENNFRTQPYRLLAGHSQGGLFATATMLDTPQLFQAYIAASPSLWWDDQIMLEHVRERLLATNPLQAKYYFSLASGDKQRSQTPIYRLNELLQYEAPASLSWKYDYFENETHSSMLLKSYYEGLMFVYRRWAIPEMRKQAGPSAVTGHFAELSKLFGYPMSLDETLANSLGYELLYTGDIMRALEYFHWNIEHFPESANAEDSLAEAYMTNGQKQQAINHYQLSLQLNPNNNNAKRMLQQLGQ